MADFEVSTRLTADARGLVQGSRAGHAALNGLKGAAGGAGAAARRTGRDYDRAGRQARQLARENRSLGGSFRAVKGALAGLGLIAVAQQGVQLADSFTLASGRLALVTREGQSASAVMDNLFERAQRARAGFTGFNQVYFRTARALRDNIALAAKSARVTELLAKSGRIGGAGAQELNAGLLQLSQGFASGELRGEELRSVMENIPDVARRIADGLGITIGQLRELAEAGGTTTETIVRAFLSQSDAIEREFAKLPRTVGEALTQLRNEIAKEFGQEAAAEGATTGLVNAIDALRDSASDVVPALVSIGATLGDITALAVDNADVLAAGGAVFLARFAGPMIQGAAQAAAAQARLTASVVTGTDALGRARTAAVERRAATLAGAQALQAEAAATVRNTQATVAQLRANLSLIQAQRAEAAELVKLAPIVGGATAARARHTAALRAGKATRLALARAERNLAKEQTAAAAATARATGAQRVHEAALRRTTVAARAASVAMRGLRGAMAFLGGPIGAAITAVSVGMLIFADRSETATEALERQRAAARRAREELERLNELARRGEATSEEENRRQRGVRDQIKQQEAALARQKLLLERSQVRRDIGRRAGDDDLVIKAERQIDRIQGRIEETTARLELLRNQLAGIFKPVESEDIGGAAGEELAKLNRQLEDFIAEGDPAAERALKLARALEEIADAAKKGADPKLVGQATAAVKEALKPITEADFVSAQGAAAKEAIRLIKLSERDRKIAEETEKRINEAKSEGVKLTVEVTKAIKQQAGAVVDAAIAEEARQKALEETRRKQREAAEELSDIFETARRDAQRAVADTFDDILAGRIDSLKDFWKEFARIGRQTISDVLAALVLSGGRVAEGSSLSPLAQTVLTGLGFPAGVAIDAAKAGRTPGINPDAPGPGGFIGGVQSFFGQTRELFKPLVDSLESALKPLFKDLKGGFGEVLGQAFAGAGLGATLASAVGLSGTGGAIGGALGSAFGPLGSIAGSIAGGLLGKLFGSTPRSSATITTGAFGELDVGRSFGKGSGREAAAVQLANNVIGGLQQIASQLDGEIAEGLTLSSIGTRKKKFVVDTAGRGRTKAKRSPDVFQFDTEAEAQAFALREAIADGAVKGLSDAVQRALKSSDNVDTALRNALRVQDLERLIESVEDPFRSAFSEFERTAKERVKVARRFGFDVLQIEKINADQRKELLEQQLKATTAPLRNLLDDLAFGSGAVGSATERRQALLTERDQLAAEAEAGDTSVLDRLARVSQQLLEVSEEAFGSTGAFADDRTGTVSLLERLLAQTEAQIRESQAAARQAGGTDQSVAQLQEANQSLDDLNLGINRMLFELRGIKASIGSLQIAGAPVSLPAVRPSVKIF